MVHYCIRLKTNLPRHSEHFM